MQFRNKSYPLHIYDRYTKEQFDWYSQDYYDGVRVNFTERIRELLFRELGETCNHCGFYVDSDEYTWGYEIDHKIPLNKGGFNDLSNLQILCRKCHKSKTKSDRQDDYPNIETGVAEFFWK